MQQENRCDSADAERDGYADRRVPQFEVEQLKPRVSHDYVEHA